MAGSVRLRLRVVAGPDYWVARAELMRRAWAAEAPLAEEVVIAELRQRMGRRGERKRVAEACGVTPAALSNIVAGRNGLSKAVAARLGLRRVVRFEKVG
jgi:hypothetical protein